MHNNTDVLCLVPSASIWSSGLGCGGMGGANCRRWPCRSTFESCGEPNGTQRVATTSLRPPNPTDIIKSNRPSSRPRGYQNLIPSVATHQSPSVHELPHHFLLFNLYKATSWAFNMASSRNAILSPLQLAAAAKKYPPVPKVRSLPPLPGFL
jgi:hypothetical protein